MKTVVRAQPRQSYVVMTGVTTAAEASSLAEVVAVTRMATRSILQGVLIDECCLTGRDRPCANPRRRPPLEQAAAALAVMPPKQRLVAFQANPCSLRAALDRLLREVPGEYVVRIESGWFEPRILRKLAHLLAGRAVMLRVSSSMWRDAIAEDGVGRIGRRLTAYAGPVTHLSVDIGNQPATPPRFDRIRALLPVAARHGFGLSVSGGLRADRLTLLGPSLVEAPALGWEVEAGIRDRDDDLDLGRCAEFLSASSRLDATIAAAHPAA